MKVEEVPKYTVVDVSEVSVHHEMSTLIQLENFFNGSVQQSSQLHC
jgi:hypothetical protein